MGRPCCRRCSDRAIRKESPAGEKFGRNLSRGMRFRRSRSGRNNAMFFSLWLIFPVAIVLAASVLFTALVMFLREYAFRPKAYSPEEFAMLLLGKLEGRRRLAPADAASEPNRHELRRRSRAPTTS